MERTKERERERERWGNGERGMRRIRSVGRKRKRSWKDMAEEKKNGMEKWGRERGEREKMREERS